LGFGEGSGLWGSSFGFGGGALGASAMAVAAVAITATAFIFRFFLLIFDTKSSPTTPALRKLLPL
jgi:hypothetical protein